MKKLNRIFASVFSAFFVLAFSSCSDLFSSDSEGDSNSILLTALLSGASFSSSLNPNITMNESATWNYSGSEDIFIVDENVGELTIYGNLNGKKIYYAPVNTTNSDVSGNYVKFVKNGVYVSPENSFIAGDISPIEVEVDVAEDAASSFSENHFSHYKAYDFSLDLKKLPSNKSVLRSIVPNYSQTATVYNIGDSKSFYVYLDSENENNYATKSATLRAKNEVCNVWVVDDYYDDTASGTKVNSAKAQSIADAFERLYPVETNIFGSESNYIYSVDRNGYIIESSMDSVSNTGTKVNIVIYDLFGDNANGNVLGFFAGRDYYPNSVLNYYGYENSSNYGKYFYIDSYYVNASETTIISTLAHEFQHMIHFGRKTMNGLNSDTNFNEMLSMLCEDMLQDFLNIPDEDSPRGRLLQFMYNYINCGIRNYDNTSLSYATAYAFGSWLCRNFGGAKLVQTMMSNGKVNNDCIVSAVNSVNNKSYTFNELFAQFIKACYGNSATYNFNKDASQTITYTSGSTTYSYPMTAINLWESGSSLYDFSQISVGNSKTLKDTLISNFTLSNGTCLLATAEDDDVGGYDYLGPVVFKNAALFSGIPASYGMWLKYVGTINESTTSLKLTFTTPSDSTRSGMKTYVYIK